MNAWNAFNAAHPNNTVIAPDDTSDGGCVFSINPVGAEYSYSDAVWIKRYNVGYNYPYIQFNTYVDSNGILRGVWLINLVPNYVQLVCQTAP